MTNLNKNTKKAQAFIHSYFNSNCYSVDTFYSNPSYTKRQIEKELLEKMQSLNGSGYKILGGNTSFFTCGYMVNGERVLIIETVGNTYRIEL